MKKELLFVLFLYATLIGNAQEIEAVDSINVETGIIYPANGVAVETPDTISVDSIMKSSVVQIPLDSCDSLMVRNPDDRYGVVWKDGKCGIFDISKWENVTNIEYKELWFSFRREIVGEYYTYFGWDEEDTKGVIGVAEVNNTFVAIWFPKNDEEGKEDEQ
jgi:hypothetical protein